MLLKNLYGKVEIHREEKILVARFLSPHRVISTCLAGGGIEDDKNSIYNHQACEPCRHEITSLVPEYANPIDLRMLVSRLYGLVPEETVTMTTAANMNNASIITRTFRELEVTAVTTGGVETNAGRAGDPAFYYEQDGIFHKIGDEEAPLEGTINSMLFINRELKSGALVQAVVTATEAKTAALQELGVNSKYSDGPATGTGTDQICAACLMQTDRPLSGSGKHTKLGQLIGEAIKDSVREALSAQNGLTPGRQRSVRLHLERFGLPLHPEGQKVMAARIEQWLTKEHGALLKNNFEAVDRDPLTVAAAAAMIHLRDKISWGVFSSGATVEIMVSQAALLAASVSGKHDRYNYYREKLSGDLPESGEGFLDFVFKAMALGFSDKWAHLKSVSSISRPGPF